MGTINKKVSWERRNNIETETERELEGALVCSGWCNRVAWLINSKDFSLRVLEAARPRSWHPLIGLVSGESPALL